MGRKKAQPARGRKASAEKMKKLLAKKGDVRRLNLDEILRVAARYKVGMYRRLGRDLEEFYRHYLERCLADRYLTPSEKEALKHLKGVLGLSDGAVERIHNEVSEAVYRRSVDEAIADGQLNDEERSFLRALREELRLPVDVADRIYAHQATELVARTLSKAVSDRRLSPGEEKEVLALASNLGASMQFGEKTRALLDRFRLYWLLENADLPVVRVRLAIPKSEKCHYSFHARWYRYRKRQSAVQYAGIAARGNILGGLYTQRNGPVAQEITPGLLSALDSGVVYLTGRRLLLSGRKRKTTIPLSRLSDFHPFLNGVQIRKQGGPTLFLEFEPGVDVFSLMLVRLLREAHPA